MMPVHQFQESDCKTSPLALLVQICSNIGAEKPTTKGSSSSSSSSSSGSDKGSGNEEIRVTKESSKDAPSACSPDTSIHSTPTLGSSVSKREDTGSAFHQREKDNASSNSKRNTPSEPRSSPMGRSSVECRRTPGSSQQDSCTSERKTPSESGNNIKSSATNGASASSLSGSDSHVPPSSTSTSVSADRESNYSSSLGLDFARTDAGLLGSKDSTAGSLGQVGLGSYKAGLNGLNPLALANCSGCSPVAGHIPLDAASATYPLAAANALKSGGYGFGSALSPYMNYARMKTATGASTFVPVCRDPYCTNCQLAAQLPYAQDRLAAHLSASSGLYPTGLPGYLPTSVPGFAGSAASAYVTSVLPRPNVCSWVAGDTYCGKRFASSEELLQHLRTHTSLAGATSSLPLYSAGVSLPSALSMDAAACGLYTTPPSLTTPAGLRRTYPTSLSPVSTLSAAGRYHPYKPPGLSPLSSAPLPPLAHPGLSFYNPYSGVYGKG